MPASYVGRVLLFLAYVSGRVHSANCLFQLFHLKLLFVIIMSQFLEALILTMNPLNHFSTSSLLDRLTLYLGLACSRSADYLFSQLIIYPNSDSTSQLTRLTTIGDISLNPGPERCSVCNSVSRKHRCHPMVSHQVRSDHTKGV